MHGSVIRREVAKVTLCLSGGRAVAVASDSRRATARSQLGRRSRAMSCIIRGAWTPPAMSAAGRRANPTLDGFGSWLPVHGPPGKGGEKGEYHEREAVPKDCWAAKTRAPLCRMRAPRSGLGFVWNATSSRIRASRRRGSRDTTASRVDLSIDERALMCDRVAEDKGDGPLLGMAVSEHCHAVPPTYRPLFCNRVLSTASIPADYPGPCTVYA